MTLQSGADGAAQIRIAGKGDALALPPLPVPVPLRVQLRAPNGRCWDARYTDVGTIESSSIRYQGKATTP